MGFYLQSVGKRDKPETGFSQEMKSLSIIVSLRLYSDLFLGLMSIYRNTFFVWKHLCKINKKKNCTCAVLWPHSCKAPSNLLNLHFVSLQEVKGHLHEPHCSKLLRVNKSIIIILLQVNICLRFRADCSSLESLKRLVRRCLSWSARVDSSTFSVTKTSGQQRPGVTTAVSCVYKRSSGVKLFK